MTTTKQQPHTYDFGDMLEGTIVYGTRKGEVVRAVYVADRQDATGNETIQACDTKGRTVQLTDTRPLHRGPKPFVYFTEKEWGVFKEFLNSKQKKTIEDPWTWELEFECLSQHLGLTTEETQELMAKTKR